MKFWWTRNKEKEEKTKVKAAQAANLSLIRKIMLVIDGSATSEEALQIALQMSATMVIPMVAVYVVDTGVLDYLQQLHVFVEEERNEFEQEMEIKGKRYLQKAKAVAETKGIPMEAELLHGRFEQMILQLVKNYDVNMIVMGGWKQSGSDKNASVRVRDRVLDAVVCPVVLVQ